MARPRKLCRVCLRDDQLVNVFDRRLENASELRLCVFLSTGVEIRRSDKIPKLICHNCCSLSVELYKFRETALANDKRLKDLVNEPDEPPQLAAEDLRQLQESIWQKLLEVKLPENPSQSTQALKSESNLPNKFRYFPDISISMEIFSTQSDDDGEVEVQHPKGNEELTEMSADTAGSTTEGNSNNDVEEVPEGINRNTETEDLHNKTDNTAVVKNNVRENICLRELLASGVKVDFSREHESIRNLFRENNAVEEISTNRKNFGKLAQSSQVNDDKRNFRTVKRKHRNTRVLPYFYSDSDTSDSEPDFKKHRNTYENDDNYSDTEEASDSSESCIDDDDDNDKSDDDDFGENGPYSKYCEYCDRYFWGISQLKSHLKVHIRCPVCIKGFESEAVLRDHLVNVCCTIDGPEKPTVSLTRVDEDVKMLAKYKSVFDEYFDDISNGVYGNPESFKNPRYYLYDTESHRLAEKGDVENIFRKFEHLDNTPIRKNSFVQTKRDQSTIIHSAKEIVLEDAYNDLVLFDIPIRFVIDRDQSAHLSYVRAPKIEKALNHWSKDEIKDLINKPPEGWQFFKKRLPDINTINTNDKHVNNTRTNIQQKVPGAGATHPLCQLIRMMPRCPAPPHGTKNTVSIPDMPSPNTFTERLKPRKYSQLHPSRVAPLSIIKSRAQNIAQPVKDPQHRNYTSTARKNPFDFPSLVENEINKALQIHQPSANQVPAQHRNSPNFKDNMPELCALLNNTGYHKTEDDRNNGAVKYSRSRATHQRNHMESDQEIQFVGHTANQTSEQSSRERRTPTVQTNSSVSYPPRPNTAIRTILENMSSEISIEPTWRNQCSNTQNNSTSVIVNRSSRSNTPNSNAPSPAQTTPGPRKPKPIVYPKPILVKEEFPNVLSEYTNQNISEEIIYNEPPVVIKNEELDIDNDIKHEIVDGNSCSPSLQQDLLQTNYNPMRYEQGSTIGFNTSIHYSDPSCRQRQHSVIRQQLQMPQAYPSMDYRSNGQMNMHHSQFGHQPYSNLHPPAIQSNVIPLENCYGKHISNNNYGQPIIPNHNYNPYPQPYHNGTLAAYSPHPSVIPQNFNNLNQRVPHNDPKILRVRPPWELQR